MDSLRDLISSRNLTEGFVSPLVEFKAKLHDWDARKDEQFDRVNVFLQFTEVEVIESTTPYTHTVAEIRIPFSNRKVSRWGFFAESCNQQVGPKEEWHSLTGKKLHLKFNPRPIYNVQKKEEVPTPCLEVVGVEGGATPTGRQGTASVLASPYVAALRLLVGKNITEFSQAALRDPVIKSDGSLVQSILNNTFFTEVLAKQIAVKDEQDRFQIDERLLVGLS